MQNKWTEEQLHQAFYLYCTLSFGKIHSKSPPIIDLALRIGRTPSAVAMKLVNFASLDPAILTTGRKGLSGASANDKKIWTKFHDNWENLIEEKTDLKTDATDLLTTIPNAELLSFEPEKTGDYILKETKIRVGQQFFRKSILANYKSKCCITGLDISALLVASHIRPWALDEKNRLNPSNGLCLSSLHDKAFDQGLISLDENYCLIVSNEVKKNRSSFVCEVFNNIEGKKIQLPEKFYPNPAFIQYHRDNIFKY